MPIDVSLKKEKSLAAVKRRVEGAQPGSAARQSLENHYEHLAQLSESLKHLGMDDRLIDEHVMHIFHEYERELLKYIESTDDEPVKTAAASGNPKDMSDAL